MADDTGAEPAGPCAAATDDARFERLLELAQLQQAAIGAWMEAEQRRQAHDPAADALFAVYFEHARAWLGAVLAFNSCWPADAQDVEPVVVSLVQTLLRTADFVAAAGDHALAAAYRHEALDLTGRHLGPVAAADVHRGQAAQLATEGRFNEALVTLDDARRVLLDAGELLTAAQASLDLVQLYDWLGDLDRALATLVEVRARTEHLLVGGAPSDQEVLAAVREQIQAIEQGRASRAGVDAAALQRIAHELVGSEARLLLKYGDAAGAEPLFHRVLGHYRTAGAGEAVEFHRNTAAGAEALFHRVLGFYRTLGAGEAIEFHIVTALVRQGRVAQARDILTRIEPAFDGGLMRPRRAALRMVQADLALTGGDPAAALDRADDGLADLDRYPDADLSWKLGLRRGRALRALGRHREALAAFALAVGHADDLRKGSLGYRLDTTFLDDKLELFGEAVDLACALHEGEATARFIELVKSRALAATMSIPPRQRTGRTPDEVGFDELCTRLDALAFQEYAATATAATRAERAALLARRRDVIERLRIADPRWRVMSTPVPFDPAATLRRLADGDRAALTLHRRGDLVVAVLLHRGDVRVARTTLTPSTTEAIGRYVANLRLAEPDRRLFDLSTATGVGWRDLVPEELADDALDAATLLVVPHGELHLLPWAGLSTGDGRRVLERTTVGLLPNLSALAVLDGAAPPDGVALIGDPDHGGLAGVTGLLHAGAEIDEIAALYGHHVVDRPRRGAEATEAAFWALAGRTDAGRTVLHVACHGDLVAGEPLSSALIMTGSRVEAAEIAMRRISCPDVVLSACSTAWRPDRAEDLPLTGDDALGLVAAFLEAGARFVLAALPPVPDRVARQFSVAWHRHRLGGASPLGALRAVQREMLARPGRPAWDWIGITGYGCC